MTVFPRPTLRVPALALILPFVLLFLHLPGAVAQPAPPVEPPPYAALADVLEDPEARARLVEELRRLAEPQAGQAPEEVAPISLPRRIANLTAGVAEGVVAEFTGAARAIAALGRPDAGLDLPALGRAVLDLTIIIAATFAVFLLLRRMVRPLYTRAGQWAMEGSGLARLVRRIVAVIGSAAVDIAVIVLAWVAGYALALFVVGETGTMDATESLFLNAFLVVEVFKALVRVLFAARYDTLRVLPMGAEEAAYWNAWLARLSGFIGYGLMFVVPMANFYLSPALGRMLTLLIMGVAFIYALVIILQNRVRVREKLEARAGDMNMAFARMLTGTLARTWHVAAIAYFGALAVVTLVRPEDALPFMVRATGESVLVVLGGLLLSYVLTRIISREIRLPEETSRNFPLLQQRLNAFIPTGLKVMRVVILIAVLALVLDAWGMFDVGGWLVSEVGARTVASAFSVALILVIAAAFWIAVASWIEHRLNADSARGAPGARERTLLTIFRNALAVALTVITAMIVLAEIGINIGPLIAGAGVLGLAIGFGAQKLVQDIITGVFIQLENAINTGDVVTAGGITGVAEKLTIRSLGIRDLSGTYHIIPFSSVDSVSNFTRDFGYHVGEYGVAYREDTDEVIEHLQAAFEELRANPEHGPTILGDLEVHGVTALADSAVNVRVRIKTLPGNQWGVGREYNRLVKRHFDAAGIEIPFPHMTLYFGQHKDGSAPPAQVTLLEAAQPQAGRHDERSRGTTDAGHPPDQPTPGLRKGDG